LQNFQDDQDAEGAGRKGMMQEEELTRAVIGCALRVHSTLGPGFLESVYEHALGHELHKQGLAFAAQQPIDVHYDGIVVGHFVADIFIRNRLIVELKAAQMLTEAHEFQLVNYLAATGIDIGLLLNFGAQNLQFKRKYRIYRVGRQD
jgi:GxxExxY protein